MKTTYNTQLTKNINEMISKKSMPLMTVLIVMIILFLLFCGGAVSVTIEFGGLMGEGWTSGISWMWIPTILFLILSIILSWVIFKKKRIILP